jgi:hypothetical protein
MSIRPLLAFALSLTQFWACSAALAAQEPAAAPASDAFDMLVLAVRHDDVPDIWNHSLPEVGPLLGTCSSLCPDETVTLLILLRHIGVDARGEGHVMVALHETLPSGEPGMQEQDIPAWSGPVPAGDMVLKSKSQLGLSYDATDPLGRHVLKLVAVDGVSGAEVEREVALDLVAWSYGEKPASEQEFEAWYQSYHQAPQPAQAVRAFLEYAQLTQGEDWNFAMVGLFRTIFDDDPWLLDPLVRTARGLDADKQARTATLLGLMGQLDRLDALYAQPEQAQQVRELMKKVKLPDPYGELVNAGQLDLLWGEFFASGRYRPVRQIVRAFNDVAGGDPVALYRISEKTDEDRATLLRRVAAQSAVWSFNSNVRQHPVVREFARWMLAHETLTETEESTLKASLMVASEDAKDAAPADPPR